MDESIYRREYTLHYCYLFALLVWALAAGPVEAGRYDEPAFLTNHLRSGGPPKDGIPALTNPIFVSPSEVGYVRDDETVMGLVINGEPRAYPHNIGWWNEIVNDRVGDKSFAVSLCPLTGTGQVFNATDVDGSQIEFGVSGLLINSNLVMYDRRDGTTLYPQMIYTAINGERIGNRLQLMPVVETTWAMWKQMYPNTTVIQTGTGWERYLSDRPPYNMVQYMSYPYVSSTLGDYRESHEYLIFLPSTTNGGFDQRFEVKDMVLGLCRDDQTKAYSFNAMPDGAVINDAVGEDQMVIVFDASSRTALAYFSEVEGRLLRFYGIESEGPLPLEFMDIETRSRWNMLGEAVAGPLAGYQLEQVPAYNAMWFAWSAYWPETEVWAPGDGIVREEDIRQITAIEEALDATPDHFALRQNYPNPFNPQTQIQYELPTAGQVQLSVYNAAGQRIRSLVDEYQKRGLYLRRWNGSDDAGRQVASGTYLYRLEIPVAGFSQTRTMSIVR